MNMVETKNIQIKQIESNCLTYMIFCYEFNNFCKIHNRIKERAYSLWKDYSIIEDKDSLYYWLKAEKQIWTSIIDNELYSHYWDIVEIIRSEKDNDVNYVGLTVNKHAVVYAVDINDVIKNIKDKMKIYAPLI